MGAKHSYGSVGRGDTLNFKPEDLRVITDPKHPLYDPRVERPPSEPLVVSIMRRGIIVPLVINRDGDGVYVTDGRQRRAAAIEANKRLKKEGGKPVVCPCVWKRGDEKTLYAIAVVTNELRDGDSQLERARKMQHLADLCGGDLEQVAVDFGCTVVTVRNTLALLECAPAVQKWVESGGSATHAAKLAKLPRTEQVKMLEKMIATGATKGQRAQRAIERNGDSAPVQPKVTAKDRARVYAALIDKDATSGMANTARLVVAVFDFISGDLNAFKPWPDVAELVDVALNPPPKTKKRTGSAT